MRKQETAIPTSSSIVADGHDRLMQATAAELAAYEMACSKRVVAHYAAAYTAAGPIRRRFIEYRINRLVRRMVRRRARQLAPPNALY